VSRPTLVASLTVLLLAGGGFAAWRVQSSQAAQEAAERRERRQRDREATRERELNELGEHLRTASAGKFPDPIADLALGMLETEVRALRPGMQPKTDAQGPGTWYEERVSPDSQVLYAFGAESHRLGQVQVLSMVRPEGVGPQLTALIDRHGSPTGAWHCEGAGPNAIPTRRFTWHQGDVSLQQVILAHPRGVSTTLYIAPTEVIAQSLRMSACRPVRDRAEMADVPVATPEQLPEVR
tara:strand:- start:631 stop:1344 length:714 start_codon:yes stop_codon:yes gene_type:complete